MPKKIETKDDLIRLVNGLVESTVRKSLVEVGLFEDEVPVSKKGTVNKAAAASPTQADGQPQNTGGGGDDLFGDMKQKSADAPTEPGNGEIPTMDQMVDKLNSIRAGRSFRDSAVEGAMSQYYEKLSEEERIALYTFLKGLAAVMTGEIPGSQAPDPNDAPNPGIEMKKKGGDPQKQAKNVTVTKTSKPKATNTAEPSNGSEDTTPPLTAKSR